MVDEYYVQIKTFQRSFITALVLRAMWSPLTPPKVHVRQLNGRLVTRVESFDNKSNRTRAVQVRSVALQLWLVFVQATDWSL